MRPNLLEWQWSTYPANHVTRANLLLHIVAVPLFQAGTLALIAGIATFTWTIAVAGLVLMIVSLAAQGRGHKGEAQPPVPFDGPVDFVTRLFAEQWVTFPRFVLSGMWRRNLASTAS